MFENQESKVAGALDTGDEETLKSRVQPMGDCCFRIYSYTYVIGVF